MSSNFIADSATKSEEKKTPLQKLGVDKQSLNVKNCRKKLAILNEPENK